MRGLFSWYALVGFEAKSGRFLYPSKWESESEHNSTDLLDAEDDY